MSARRRTAWDGVDRSSRHKVDRGPVVRLRPHHQRVRSRSVGCGGRTPERGAQRNAATGVRSRRRGAVRDGPRPRCVATGQGSHLGGASCMGRGSMPCSRRARASQAAEPVHGPLAGPFARAESTPSIRRPSRNSSSPPPNRVSATERSADVLNGFSNLKPLKHRPVRPEGIRNQDCRPSSRGSRTLSQSGFKITFTHWRSCGR